MREDSILKNWFLKCRSRLVYLVYGPLFSLIFVNCGAQTKAHDPVLFSSTPSLVPNSDVSTETIQKHRSDFSSHTTLPGPPRSLVSSSPLAANVSPVSVKPPPSPASKTSFQVTEVCVTTSNGTGQESVRTSRGLGLVNFYGLKDGNGKSIFDRLRLDQKVKIERVALSVLRDPALTDLVEKSTDYKWAEPGTCLSDEGKEDIVAVSVEPGVVARTTGAKYTPSDPAHE